MNNKASALPEPLTIGQWWKNRRGESIRLTLDSFESRSIINLRTWFTDATDGQLKPGKGFAAEVKHLPRLAAAMVKAGAKARELGLIDDEVTDDTLQGAANE